jgi:hypothetical protein
MAPKLNEVSKMRPEIAVKSEALLFGGVSQGEMSPNTPSMSPEHGNTIGPSSPSPIASWRLERTNERKNAILKILKYFTPYKVYSTNRELNIRSDSLRLDRAHQFFLFVLRCA